MTLYAVAAKPRVGGKARRLGIVNGAVRWDIGRLHLTDADLKIVKAWNRRRPQFKVTIEALRDPNPFKSLEVRFGLRRTSGDHDAPGVHAPHSYHYQPAPWGGVSAYDYGDSVNTHAKLVAVATYLRSLVPGRYQGCQLREVFGTFPWYIKDSRVYPGQFPGHGDHLHVALTK